MHFIKIPRSSNPKEETMKYFCVEHIVSVFDNILSDTTSISMMNGKTYEIPGRKADQIVTMITSMTAGRTGSV